MPPFTRKSGRCHVSEPAKWTTGSGFTLIELLLAMSIIAALAAIVISAINPLKQFADARNTQRQFDVNMILNGFGQYSIDHNGSFTPGDVDGVGQLCPITSISKKLCKASTLHGSLPGECAHAAVNCVWTRHLSGVYMAEIPIDPTENESDISEQAMIDYEVDSSSPGRFRVIAPNAENEMSISTVR